MTGKQSRRLGEWLPDLEEIVCLEGNARAWCEKLTSQACLVGRCLPHRQSSSVRTRLSTLHPPLPACV